MSANRPSGRRPSVCSERGMLYSQRRLSQPKMTPGGRSCDTTSLRAHQETLSNQKRLSHLFNGFPLLTY